MEIRDFNICKTEEYEICHFVTPVSEETLKFLDLTEDKLENENFKLQGDLLLLKKGNNTFDIVEEGNYFIKYPKKNLLLNLSKEEFCRGWGIENIHTYKPKKFEVEALQFKPTTNLTEIVYFLTNGEQIDFKSNCLDENIMKGEKYLIVYNYDNIEEGPWYEIILLNKNNNGETVKYNEYIVKTSDNNFQAISEKEFLSKYEKV